MKLVVFGLTISSAWGNGHATPWRGLCRALAARGHHVIFYERDVAYYAAHRDAPEPAGCELRLYPDWGATYEQARDAVADADVAIVTSYCPDGQDASDLVLASRRPLRVFYDLDTPVTLERLARGLHVDYLPTDGLGAFDLVLSFTGGRALEALKTDLGARVVAPLYGSVDPEAHHPVPTDPGRHFDFTYLGTYSADRQAALEEFFIEPARRRPDCRFALAGSMYPADGFPWQPNIFYLAHMPPTDHPSFYCSSAWTLNITRGPMAQMGYCPSGRLFEAAACGTPIVSDGWEGLDTFFTPRSEILIVQKTEDVLDALDMDPAERRRIGQSARARALAEHTADARVEELERVLAAVRQRATAREPSTRLRGDAATTAQADNAPSPPQGGYGGQADNAEQMRGPHVGNHSGGGPGQPHAATGVFEGAPAGRQPA
jgi:spore maturation protein CgeB